MSTIKLRRSAIPGRIPNTSQLELGELAINTADGKIYFKQYDPVANTESIIDISSNLDAAAILAELLTVDGTGSGLDADLLDGESGDYYLDYNNFTNVPAASLDLTLEGKVTGTAFSNTGVMTLTTELANTGVIAGTYGSASQVPVFTVDEDGRLTNANTVSVAGVSDTSWDSANNTFTIETADGGSYDTVIGEFTNPTILGAVGRLTFDSLVAPEIRNQDGSTRIVFFGEDYTPNTAQIYLYADTNVWVGTDLSVTGNISVTGTVDGRDIAADGAKLDTLEDGLDLTLTGKVTGTATSNTGVMTLTTELANTGVTAGEYGSATAIPVITIDEDGRITLASTASVSGVEDFSWNTANNTLQLETGDGTFYNVVIESFNDISANNITVDGTVDGRDIAADGSKLDGIEPGATADQTAADIRALGFFDTTNDGTNSLLDADLLDGYHASDILAQAANTAAAQIGNGLITITGGAGLDGSGTFNLNDGINTSITIDHTDTSSVSDVDNSGGSVLQDITFDTFGHVLTVASTDLDDRYYTETELNAGQLNNLYYTETELDAGQLDNRYYTETELDTGQLDNRYYTETELDAGQLDTRYYTEAELDAGQLDNRYYTETEADNRFVNVSGDTITGNLTIQGNLSLNNSTLVSASATTTSTTSTTIYAFPAASFGGAEFVITASEGGERHTSKIILAHNGTTAMATEYAVIFTDAEIGEYDVSISGGLVNLTTTSATSNSTDYKITGTLTQV